MWRKQRAELRSFIVTEDSENSCVRRFVCEPVCDTKVKFVITNFNNSQRKENFLKKETNFFPFIGKSWLHSRVFHQDLSKFRIVHVILCAGTSRCPASKYWFTWRLHQRQIDDDRLLNPVYKTNFPSPLERYYWCRWRGCMQIKTRDTEGARANTSTHGRKAHKHVRHLGNCVTYRWVHVPRPGTFDKSRRRACEYLRPVYAELTQKSSSIIHNSLFLGRGDRLFPRRAFISGCAFKWKRDAVRLPVAWKLDPARLAAPRCPGQFRSHGYFIPWRPFLHRKMYEKFPKKGWKMENFSQRKLKTNLPDPTVPLLSSRASLQRNGLIQEITALPLLIYYVPSVYCPRLFPTYFDS